MQTDAASVLASADRRTFAGLGDAPALASDSMLRVSKIAGVAIADLEALENGTGLL